MGVVVGRFDIHLVNLGPTVGREFRKTRPCLVISPDEMNHNLSTVIVAPMTSRGRAYPSRVPCIFQGRGGHIALDQMRALDKTRLVRRLGELDTETRHDVLLILANMFA